MNVVIGGLISGLLFVVFFLWIDVFMRNKSIAKLKRLYPEENPLFVFKASKNFTIFFPFVIGSFTAGSLINHLNVYGYLNFQLIFNQNTYIAYLIPFTIFVNIIFTSLCAVITEKRIISFFPDFTNFIGTKIIMIHNENILLKDIKCVEQVNFATYNRIYFTTVDNTSHFIGSFRNINMGKNFLIEQLTNKRIAV